MRRALAWTGGLAALLLIFCGATGYFDRDPFVMMPAQAPRSFLPGTAAVLFSGDMGLNMGLGPQVIARLRADGVPVLGVNSLAFFRTRRTAPEVSALVAEAIRRARAATGARRVILIGQSYGADMLQAGLAGLPARSRRDVAFVALIVPGATIAFRASPSEIFTFADAEQDARPSAETLGWAPTLCVYGREESASLCPLLHRAHVSVVALPGGHPLNHDPARLYAVIRQAARSALGAGEDKR